MITVSDMMPMLSEVFEEYKEIIDAKKSEKGGQDDDILSIKLYEFSYYLVQCVQAGKLESLPKVFDVIESFFDDGDEKVKRAATMGLLGTIQDTATSANVDLRYFVNYLKPESRKRWNMLEEIWTKCNE